MAKRLKKKKKRKLKSYMLLITTLILFALMIYSGLQIISWIISNLKNKDIQESLSQYILKEDDVENEDNIETEKIKVDFKSLKEKNNDTVAWLKVNNTEIDYPVVKGIDNKYYLTHNFDKEYNKAGWIFADYRNKFDYTDRNLVIYGHNMKSNLMFGTLKNVLDEEWYNNEENKYISFITENANEQYKIFSIYETEAEEYYIKTEFKNDKEFAQFLENIKKKSIKNFETDVSSPNRILTLSTCSKNSNYRIVVHAIRIAE